MGKDGVHDESGLRDKNMTKKNITELLFCGRSEHVWDAKQRFNEVRRTREDFTRLCDDLSLLRIF
ncbi:hypothetical protein KKHLCK_11670 [Candidatus Electrothrix laxa]